MRLLEFAANEALPADMTAFLSQIHSASGRRFLASRRARPGPAQNERLDRSGYPDSHQRIDGGELIDLVEERTETEGPPRSSLRLGIREMRVIGQDAGPGFVGGPGGRNDHRSVAISMDFLRLRWIPDIHPRRRRHTLVRCRPRSDPGRHNPARRRPGADHRPPSGYALRRRGHLGHPLRSGCHRYPGDSG